MMLCARYVPLGLGAFFRSHSITQVREMSWWDSVAHEGSSARIVMTPAQVPVHLSGWLKEGPCAARLVGKASESMFQVSCRACELQPRSARAVAHTSKRC